MKLLQALRRATGITGSGAILLAVAVVAWIAARIAGGRPLYLLAYAAAVVLAIAWFVSRRRLPVTGARSEARPRLREGETVTMEVALTAGRRLSTFVLEERIPSSLGTTTRVAVAGAEPGQTIAQGYKLTPHRRGVFHIGPLVARWGDPFGLTEREAVLAEPVELLVHPSIEPVSDRPLTRLWEDPPIRPPVSKPWPSGMEFYGMRDYQPGDDLRQIVWRAFGRTGRLLVREAEQGITDRITIILDTTRANHSRGDPSESFEAGVRAAASLGIRHLREGYSVTLEANVARLAPSLRGRPAQIAYLDALARVDLTDAPLSEAITRLVGDAKRDAHVVLITPLLDSTTASKLRLLLERGTSVLVAALVWDEFSTETLGTAASLGCQVIELRPNTPLAAAFRAEVGAGRL